MNFVMRNNCPTASVFDYYLEQGRLRNGYVHPLSICRGARSSLTSMNIMPTLPLTCERDKTYEKHQKRGISQDEKIASSTKKQFKIRNRWLSTPRLAKLPRLSVGEDVTTGSIAVAAFGFAIGHRVNARFLRGRSRLDSFVLYRGLLRPACLLILLIFEETFQCSSWCHSWSGFFRQRLLNWFGSGSRGTRDGRTTRFLGQRL